MKPKPWSPSSLEKFVQCPRQYFELKALPAAKRRYRDADTREKTAGTEIHKHFENRMKSGTRLPPYLREHEPLFAKLEAMPGRSETEMEVGLNLKREPCTVKVADLWWRGIIDFHKVHKTHGIIVDYKTGKPKNSLAQLQQCALYLFAWYPALETVDVRYYWTKTKSMTGARYTRADVPRLWALFVPDLKQYVQAYQTNTWQPRPSPLCAWCPVVDCEHHKSRPFGR